METFVSVGVQNIKLTKDIDVKLGKLKKATLKLDYTTEISGGVKREKTNEVGTDLDGDEYKSVRKLSTVLDGYKNAMMVWL